MADHDTHDHTGVPGVGGAVATDAIWDAAGDLAVGSGADTAAKLTKGSDGDVLTVTAGVVGWAAPSGAGEVGAAVEYLLSADVNLNSSLTYQDGPSGTPSAGTYVIHARAAISKGAGNSSDNWIARLLKGATEIDVMEIDVNADGNGGTSTASLVLFAGPVVLNGSTAIKLQATAFRTTPILKKDVAGLTDNTHMQTKILAVRIA